MMEYFAVEGGWPLEGQVPVHGAKNSALPILAATLLADGESIIHNCPSLTDCAAALESVGLDSYVGFLHRDRPGRTSLALDLMEELRPCMADRFVLTILNNRVLPKDAFQFQGNGAVLLSEGGRRTFLKHWQERKRETITHPYLKEKISWGLVPYVQALLLVRTLRDDLDGYPPFLWK